jgi:hypothetical protein
MLVRESPHSSMGATDMRQNSGATGFFKGMVRIIPAHQQATQATLLSHTTQLRPVSFAW